MTRSIYRMSEIQLPTPKAPPPPHTCPANKGTVTPLNAPNAPHPAPHRYACSAGSAVSRAPLTSYAHIHTRPPLGTQPTHRQQATATAQSRKAPPHLPQAGNDITNNDAPHALLRHIFS